VFPAVDAVIIYIWLGGRTLIAVLEVLVVLFLVVLDIVDGTTI
jgi:hypothetical protein